MVSKHYIDTSSPDSNFSMPDIGVDYKDWLLNKYEKSVMEQDGRPAFYGIGQKINHLIFEAKEHEHQLIAFGKNAKDVAAVIDELSHGLVTVEVVK